MEGFGIGFVAIGFPALGCRSPIIRTLSEFPDECCLAEVDPPV